MKTMIACAAVLAAAVCGCGVSEDVADPPMTGGPIVAVPAELPDAAPLPMPDAVRPAPQPIPPVCGNGEVETGEACDDGNPGGQDGCSATCEIEPLCCCGNGAVEPGETCDDGNTADGDGCDAGCQLEPG